MRWGNLIKKKMKETLTLLLEKQMLKDELKKKSIWKRHKKTLLESAC